MDADEKISRLKALLEDDPDQAADPLSWFMLGREQMTAGHLEDSTKSFEKCISLNPGYSAAYRHLGDCHRQAGNNEKAREVYESGMIIANESGDLQVVKEIQVFLKKLEG